jgi:Ala-tRNA(Pro) deacylase
MNPHAAPTTLAEELQSAGIPYELLPHPRTQTALAEAAALHVEPREVGKTIILATSEGLVRALIPASERIDLRKVETALGDDEVELLSERALAGAYPEFELGAVPPIGGARGDRVLVDIGVCENKTVLIEAGTHGQSVRLAVDDLLAHEQALIADICLD